MILIHQFNPEIYPYKLWIAVTENEDSIKERFNNKNDKELEIGLLYTSKAITCTVVKKDSRDRGILIIFRNRKWINFSTVSHESVHAARFMWGMMGETEIGDEADAYLAGWVARCCETVKKYKPSKDGQANDINN